MRAADELAQKLETTERRLEGAGPGSFDSLKKQLRGVFKDFERPSHQSKQPAEDLHSSDDRLNEPFRNTPKDFQRPNPRKPAEDEPVERDDLHSESTPFLDYEASEHKAIYDRSIENEMKRRSSRGFASYLVAICIGVTATLAWQSYGDATKRVMATNAPELGWSPESKQMIASWVQQLGWAKSPADSEKQAAAVAQTAHAALSLDPEKVQQMARDLATLRQTVEQLAAGLDQVTREIGKLEAADMEILAKITPAPPLPRPIAPPARKPAPMRPPSSQAPITPPTSLETIPPPDQ